MKNVLEWVGTLLVGIVIAIVLKVYIVQGYNISGDSMLPTFQSGDFVFAEKISYKTSGLKYGQIVIVEPKNTEHKRIIKRVVGLEGDKIKIENGVLYRNDKKVSEKYIEEEMYSDFEEIKVPKGEIFVLGDNRNNSSDSRYFGTFKKEQLRGKVFMEVLNNPLKFY